MKRTHTKHDWWQGSNGNLFRDVGGYRYCIDLLASERRIYRIYRNGHEIAATRTVADAQRLVAARPSKGLDNT